MLMRMQFFFKTILDKYIKASGQIFNLDKSSMFLSMCQEDIKALFS